MIHKFIIELTDDCKEYNEEVERLEREYGIEPVEEHDANVRTTVINECIEIIKDISRRNCSYLLDEIVYSVIVEMEYLKEKKND